MRSCSLAIVRLTGAACLDPCAALLRNDKIVNLKHVPLQYSRCQLRFIHTEVRVKAVVVGDVHMIAVKYIVEPHMHSMPFVTVRGPHR